MTEKKLRCDDPCPFGGIACYNGPISVCYREEATTKAEI